MYLPYDYDSTYLYTEHPEDGIVYKNYIRYYGPFTWLANNIGIGFIANITKQFYLQQRFGAGMVFIFGNEPILVKYNTRWEFIGLINIALIYKFKSP